MSQDDINSSKVSYLLNLLGKSSLSHTHPRRESSSSSDFEDVPENLVMMLSQPPIEPDSLITPTTQAQGEVEDTIREIYQDLIDESSQEHRGIRDDPLQCDRLVRYLNKSLHKPMSEHYFVYDPNHGWMLYWLLNSHYILKDQSSLPDNDTKALVSNKISSCLVDGGRGGIGGGANQLGHMASAYASVLALVLIQDFDTLDQIRQPLYQWLLDLKLPNGSFMMHYQGEHDARSTYCALVIASLLNIMTDELTQNTLNWLNQCQTYEGGFAGVPEAEAHGGYTFCSLASYFFLLGDSQDSSFADRLKQNIDVDALIRWCAHRQLQLEGGFSGRTNKLVDACYSFWVGAVLALLEPTSNYNASLFSRESLKSYILNCCQNSSGGFQDKPGKSVDYYHTNYTLAGLSIAEYTLRLGKGTRGNTDDSAYCFTALPASEEVDRKSELNPINPVFGLPLGSAEACKQHFTSKNSH